MVAPGLISLEQAIATMGLEAKNRLTMRFAPLRTAGLSQAVVELLPPADQEDYEKFVAGSTFDPVKDLAGGVLYSDHDLSNTEMAHFTLILAVESDGKLEPLINHIAHAESEEDKDEKIFTGVFLSQLSAKDRKRCSDHLQIADDGDRAFEHKDLGDADLIYRQEGTFAEYAYVWSGGILFSAVDVGEGSVLEAISPALRSLLTELTGASRFAPKAGDTGLVLNGRGFGQGTTASFTVRVADDITADLAIVMPSESSESAVQIVQAWPELQKTPSLLGDFGPKLQEVSRLVLGATEATLQEGSLVFHTGLQTALLRGALANAAK